MKFNNQIKTVCVFQVVHSSMQRPPSTLSVPDSDDKLEFEVILCHTNVE